MRVQDEESAKLLRSDSRKGQVLPSVGNLVLPVAGAGRLEVGQYQSSCGGGVGISVGCSWGMFGYAGGVLHREHIVELRDHLTKFLDGTLEIINSEPTVIESSP